MLNLFTNRPPVSEPISRQSLINLLEAAFQTHEYRYARQISLGWLAFFPGDLEVKRNYAHAMYRIGFKQQAISVLDEIIRIDPEDLETLKLRANMLGSQDVPEQLNTSLYILDSSHTWQPGNFALAETFRRSYQWLKDQDRPLATWEVNSLGLPTGLEEGGIASLASHVQLDLPLLGVIHLRCLATQQADNHAIRLLAGDYLARWPDCLAFKLILAQYFMPSDPDAGVAYLHEAVTVDTSAQVAKRIWGSDFTFRKIWPGVMEVAPGHPTSPQSIPVPAPISALLGWNQLPEPPIKGKDVQPEGVRQNQKQIPQKPLFTTQIPHSPKSGGNHYSYPIISELRQIAKTMKLPALSRVDGRYPVYVILSTRHGLVNQYGEIGAGLVIESMQQLAEVIANYRQWDSLVFLADDPDFMSLTKNIEIEASQPQDPWAIKLALTDLDAELSKVGEMIGAVLIVGGPEILPFHHLPNPVDDSDRDVPSDNPYATRDENYFVPEWPVGRLPSGNSNDAGMLVKLLQNTIEYHNNQNQSRNRFAHFWVMVRKSIHDLRRPPWRKRKSYGYSAAVWRRASVSVFRPIGDPHHLIVSPPAQVSTSCAIRRPNKSCISLPLTRLAYFNLHGLPDTDEWYGQRDPAEPGDDQDFPLALRAADIRADAHLGQPAPEIVFSEACFGAHILEKKIDEAIALKFLASGSKVVVGSTCISYGSIGTPLIAADLLGHTFWHYLMDGQPAGEALRRAKIRLVKEMNQRQGYLDGEDQKSLLSFVFYGDPLIQIHDLARGPKTIMRSNQSQTSVQTVCDRTNGDLQSQKISKDTLVQVKEFVAEYLPGMSDADLHFSYERLNCEGSGHICPTSQLQSKSPHQQRKPTRRVVTLSKTIQENSHKHAQFARMTIDEQGKLVKLVVSR